jgi:hypothetical protein
MRHARLRLSEPGATPHPFRSTPLNIKGSDMRSNILIALAGIAWAFAGTGIAQAHDQWNHAYADGLSVFLGVQPAAMATRTHPRDHPEGEMHEDRPVGRYDQHVFVAVFDAETGERIEDAAAEARAAPLGLGPVTRSLEPMVIADTITYGNFFTMRSEGIHEIRVTVTRGEAARRSVIEFTYDHRTR